MTDGWVRNDYATLPDEYLFAGDETENPIADGYADLYQEDPRATSPP